MPRSRAPQGVPPTNHLLARLPPRELGRVSRRLELVGLTSRTILHESDQDIDYVYFPTSCIVSLLSRADGQIGSIEVGVIGQEGMAGLPAFLRMGRSGLRSIVQVSGEALRLNADEVCRLAASGSALHTLLLRYTHLLLSQVAQAVACNSLHPVEKRLCRWLLAMHDRSGLASFSLTHEFLAGMLGVRRASVTEAARRLRRAGLIRYGGGRLTVVDRPGLEEAACGCYRLVQAEMERTLL
jgi:CRP-like cAMP-binding protein